MSQSPTDPMTPVRALIEAATDYQVSGWPAHKLLAADAAVNALPSLSQLLSEHDKVVALIAELRKREVPEHNDYIDVSAEKSAYEWCADVLATIVEGK